MEDELLIAVDEHDNPVGEIEKMEAHKKGILHRAFSVFIFNSDGRWLLQQRGLEKYHSPGLWTNACCSHPHTGETLDESAIKRLHEEMGIRCHVKHVFSFTYRATFENGLCEYEYDHIFTGICDDLPVINPKEVSSYRYLSYSEIKAELKENPESYTSWFRLMFENVNLHKSEKSYH